MTHRNALVAAGLLLGAFAGLAALTTLSAVDAVDIAVDRAVNTVMAAHPPLVVATVVVTTAGSPVTVDVLTALAAAVAWRRAGRRVALYLVAARLVELGIETAVKALVGRPRPVLPHPLAQADNLSFPSGHTAGTAVFCTALVVAAWPALRRRSLAVALAAVATAAIAASRVALGLHYPTDVVGGALLGVAVALALRPLLPREGD